MRNSHIKAHHKGATNRHQVQSHDSAARQERSYEKAERQAARKAIQDEIDELKHREWCCRDQAASYKRSAAHQLRLVKQFQLIEKDAAAKRTKLEKNLKNSTLTETP